MRTCCKEFPKRLRQLIKEEMQTDSAFAIRCKLTPAAMSQLLSGYRDPQLSTLLKINKSTNVSIDWLLGLKGGGNKMTKHHSADGSE